MVRNVHVMGVLCSCEVSLSEQIDELPCDTSSSDMRDSAGIRGDTQGVNSYPGLANWGFALPQDSGIASRSTPERHLPLHSPTSTG